MLALYLLIRATLALVAGAAALAVLIGLAALTVPAVLLAGLAALWTHHARRTDA